MKYYKYLIEQAVFQEILSLAVSIVIYALVLVNYMTPSIRTMGIKVDSGFASVIPILALILYLAFRLPGWFGKTISLSTTLLFFGLTLVGLWGAGQSQATVISGLIPNVDASSYYIDALRLINSQVFSIFSARRPIFPAMMSALLWISGGNLMLTMGIMAGVNGLSCYFLSYEIKRTHGPLVAAFMLIILLFFYRLHSGAVMTEQLGLSLGALGFAFIWRGADVKNKTSILIGLFICSLSLNARVGALFTLPAMILWGAYLFRHENGGLSWMFMALSVCIVLLAFVINFLFVRIFAEPAGMPFANFSYSLYGLASGGKGWAYIFQVHPEFSTVQEPEHSRTIYKLAFEVIREKPYLLLQGVWINYLKFFFSPYYGAFSYIGGSNITHSTMAQWILLILSCAGIINWKLDPGNTHLNLVMAAVIGLVLSVPFAPPGDTSYLRTYAASIMILAILPALGLSFVMDKIPGSLIHIPENDRSEPSQVLLPFSLFYILFILVFPLILRLAITPPASASQSTCPANLIPATSRVDKGTYINLVDDKRYAPDVVPDFHYSYFKRELHDSSGKVLDWANFIKPANSIFLSLDQISSRGFIFVIPSDLMPNSDGLYDLCGTIKENGIARSSDHIAQSKYVQDIYFFFVKTLVEKK